MAPTEALSPQEQQQKFHLPPGFEIQLVAAEPDIQKPMNLAFDPRGRLWVTHSVEYPYPVEERKPGRDGVTILDEIGPDGRAKKITRFADDLNIPIGLLPLRDGALVYSIPSIWRMVDDDGDDRADRREVLITKVGTVDTHGMVNSFTYWIDGWVYACHGFSNTSTLRGVDGSQITMNSGNIFRFKPDGTRLEQWTWGQVNPFGLSFDRRGNLFSSDCHTKPLYQLLRGAYYPSFGKPHDGLGYGPEMIDHLHGSTGIAGVVIYEAAHFPKEWHSTAFIGNPVTSRINHDRLEPHGSTYKAIEQPDFLTCDDHWFRPVDVQLGPDGALYIADFYNCIIGHYEVPLTHPRRDRTKGRIWRVVYRGSDPSAKALGPLRDFTQRTEDEIIDDLRHPNLRVNAQASHELVARYSADKEHVPSTVVSSNPKDADPRDAALAGIGLWIHERTEGLDESAWLSLVRAKAPSVRAESIKLMAGRGAWSAEVITSIRERLNDEDPFVQRAAAAALGRHPTADNLKPLLARWSAAPADDTHLIHTVRMALRDQLLAPDVYAAARELALKNADAAARLADVSLGARTPESAAFVLEYLTRPDAPRARLEEFLHHAARYVADEQLGSVYSYAEVFMFGETAEQLATVRALHRAARERGGQLPEAFAQWGARLVGELLSSRDEPQARDGLELAREMRPVESFLQAVSLAQRDSQFPGLRVAALDVCAELDGPRAVSLLGGMALHADESREIRQRACAALGRIGSPEAQAELQRLLPTLAQGLDIAAAEALAASAPGGTALLDLIAAGKASPRLLLERGIEVRLRNAKVPGVDDTIKTLVADLPPTDARVSELLAKHREGFHKAGETARPDARTGLAIFEKRCANCHRLEGKGQKIGPELDGIGLRGADRLLEDLLDPSRNVDQAFRTTLVTTTDGLTRSGLALREEGELLVLADAEGKELRIPQDTIAERIVAPLSPMPANLGDVLPPEELYALLSYLLEQTQAKPAIPARSASE